jgi:hypothetical protein
MYASACHENAEIRDRFPIYRGPFASGALIHHLLALNRRHATMYTLCVEAPGWESCAGKQPGRHTKARLPAPNASSAAEQKTPVAEPLKPTQSLPLKGVRDTRRHTTVQADWEAGASGPFWTAIWRVAASFSERGGMKSSDLEDHSMRQHPRVAGLSPSDRSQSLDGPADVQ